MPARRVGILHPGQMGTVVAATLRNTGNDVSWASAGRSTRTRERAASLGLREIVGIGEMCAACDAIFSVCPPEFADQVADSVLEQGFRGLYIDANAISPERVKHMAARMSAAGIRFVDGGIIGPAVQKPDTTWMYLSGEHAAEAAALLSGGPMRGETIPGGPGQASALKMCYAAYSKGSTALLCATWAASERLGVRGELERHWQRSTAGSPDVAKSLSLAAPRAWRWAPEMREIAATFESTGLPPEFHQAAAEIFEMLESFKDGRPDLQEILRALSQAAAAGEPR
jgi:3-hydroxyisobutyrate dehydrogenase-like beta-hydroxyacid dehydrogenase